MKFFNFSSLVFLLVFTGYCSEGSAGTWTCRQDGITRNVIVFYPDETARLPCKVYYGKPDENALPRVLWESVNTPDYCERKAAEFVEKLGAMGWRCRSDDREH